MVDTKDFFRAFLDEIALTVKKEVTDAVAQLKTSSEEDVILTGHLDRNGLRDYLHYCDISISAIPPESYYKISSPTKLYESLGNSIPVVANREILEQEKVILESGGGILANYETTSFCNAIVNLLSDRKLREEMGRKGKEYVINNYSYRLIAQKIFPYFL